MKTINAVIFFPFLFILLLVTPVNGSLDDWVEYYRSTNGNVFLYRVKHRTQDIVQVWDKYVFSDESKKKIFEKMIKEGWSTTYVKISHSLSLVEIDCKTERSRILSITFYNMDGQSLFPNSSIKQDWDYIIILNSPYVTLRKEVCK